MKYVSPLIVVKNIEKSKRFYCGLFGLDVAEDCGANVILSCGLNLQEAAAWTDFVKLKADEIKYGGNDAELYFEEDDLDGFAEKLKGFNEAELLHEIIEHPWGQRAVRIYDPDKHIIEIAESIETVIKRFLASGLSMEETAKRMDVSLEYITSRAPESNASCPCVKEKCKRRGNCDECRKHHGDKKLPPYCERTADMTVDRAESRKERREKRKASK